MTRAQAMPTMRDDDTDTIAALRRELARVNGQLGAVTADRDAVTADRDAVTADRDGLLHTLARITTAIGLPEGHDVDKVIQRIEGIA